MTGEMRVSVVIPVKDDGELLRRCLQALAAQSLPADEIIVVDNASSDDSAQIALDAGATVLHCSEPGIAAASATGYDAASGHYILRLDADCVPGAGWVRTMHDCFAAHPDVAVVTGGAHFFDGPRALRRWLAACYLGAYRFAATAALGHVPMFGSNLAFRRSAWHEVREHAHLDAELHDDLDLSYHFGERHRIKFERTADMEMSSRPLTSLSGFRRRFRMGMRTVVSHWPRDFPPHRWWRLARTRAETRSETRAEARASARAYARKQREDVRSTTGASA